MPKARPPLAGQATVPIVFSLDQNYPNPCNPMTEIRYQLPEQCSVRLRVYNLMGQEVMRLVDKVEAAGMHAVRWLGRDALGRKLASGVYIYRLEAGGLVASRKLALAR
ncbi:MAG: T9SS type A sorting domain-containing protein [Candidatus Oleimicrobiaceae bacterium]